MTIGACLNAPLIFTERIKARSGLVHRLMLLTAHWHRHRGIVGRNPSAIDLPQTTGNQPHRLMLAYPALIVIDLAMEISCVSACKRGRITAIALAMKAMTGHASGAWSALSSTQRNQFPCCQKRAVLRAPITGCEQNGEDGEKKTHISGNISATKAVP